MRERERVRGQDGDGEEGWRMRKVVRGGTGGAGSGDWWVYHKQGNVGSGGTEGGEDGSVGKMVMVFFFKQETAYEIHQ